MAMMLTTTGTSFKVKEAPLFSWLVATFTVGQKEMAYSFECEVIAHGRKLPHILF